MECSTSRRSFTATVHVRRTTCKSVAYSPFLRYSISAFQPESSLKKADFMNYILPGLNLPVFLPVFCGHHEYGKGSTLKHLCEPFDRGEASSRRHIELFHLKTMFFGNVVPDLLPIHPSPMSNKDCVRHVARFVYGEVADVGEQMSDGVQLCGRPTPFAQSCSTIRTDIACD